MSDQNQEKPRSTDPIPQTEEPGEKTPEMKAVPSAVPGEEKSMAVPAEPVSEAAAKSNGDTPPGPTDEQILEANKQLLEANRAAAIEWIQSNQGRGMVMGVDPAGEIRMWIVGGADDVTREEDAKVDSQLFNLIFMLIAAHLPGASNTMMAMHQENSMRLQALLQNQQAIVSLLQMQIPNLQVNTQDLRGNPVQVPGAPAILKKG